ncbi:MAG: hypothetical protein MUF54_02075 [Polyangiaceae bacterium]|nr:hypothetical protein [Polyangiaceae bacterium]
MSYMLPGDSADIKRDPSQYPLASRLVLRHNHDSWFGAWNSAELEPAADASDSRKASGGLLWCIDVTTDCSKPMHKTGSVLFCSFALLSANSHAIAGGPIPLQGILHNLPLPASWSTRPNLPSRDRDRDGLPDRLEEALGYRYAPVVVLHRDEWARPASISWLFAGMGRGSDVAPSPSLQIGRIPVALRNGSTNPDDWGTYVHVFPSADGARIHLQYWFFYPFSDGVWFFHHDGDWEHVTVTLDRQLRPLGVAAARHGNSGPGVWRPWSEARKVHGTHPEILSAKGTHASYFHDDEPALGDKLGRCQHVAGPCAHFRWRTWERGGLRQVGERRAPLEPVFMGYRGRWGHRGALPGTAAPRSPHQQGGWCIDGGPACTLYDTEAR